MTRIGNLVAWLPAQCATGLLRLHWLIWAVGGAAIVLFAAVPLAMDLVVLNRATVDFTYPLDTSLRWAFGHWPHLDYQTPVGIAYWLNQGLAGAILGLSAKSIFLANIIAAILIGGAALVLVRRRLASGHAAILVTGLLALVLSPRMFGDPWDLVSYLAPYNKIGLALLGVLMVAYFVEPRAKCGSRMTIAESLVAGALIVWLIYLKLNFAAIAIAGGVVALYFAPANRAVIVGSILVAVSAGVVVAVGTGIAPAYLYDIRFVATVGGVFRPNKLAADLAGSLPTLALFGAAAIAYRLSSHAESWPRVVNLTVACGLLAACIVAMNQVHGNDLPLAFVAAIILSERALRETATTKTVAIPPYAGPLLVAGLLVLQSVYKDVRAIDVYASDQRDGRALHFCDDPEIPSCAISYAYFDAHALRTLQPFPAPHLRSVPPAPADVETFQRRAKSVEQHLAACNDAPLCALWAVYGELYGLLNLVMVAGDRPYLLGFMNPIPYYYGIEPPKHVPAWIDMGRTLSATTHPDADVLFSDVTLLVVPMTELAQDYRLGLLPIYADDIDARFDKVAETESWSIWRPKPIDH